MNFEFCTHLRMEKRASISMKIPTLLELFQIMSKGLSELKAGNAFPGTVQQALRENQLVLKNEQNALV